MQKNTISIIIHCKQFEFICVNNLNCYLFHSNYYGTFITQYFRNNDCDKSLECGRWGKLILMMKSYFQNKEVLSMGD